MGFFDDNPFGGMFDWDGDGKESFFEQMVGIGSMEAMMNDDDDESYTAPFGLDLRDDTDWDTYDLDWNEDDLDLGSDDTDLDYGKTTEAAEPPQETGEYVWSDTRANDNENNKKAGVHFFVDDFRFSGIYDHPDKSFEKYAQYAFLLTPDFSLYADMPLWKQLENVAKNRWVGAYWQSKGLTVIPTVAWSTPRSFEFCFDGIEQNGIVAIGMIGCKKNKLGFLRGYEALLEKKCPNTIITFGTPFPEMQGNIIAVDYQQSRKVVR